MLISNHPKEIKIATGILPEQIKILNIVKPSRTNSNNNSNKRLAAILKTLPGCRM
jgi:hypothetical protein